MTIETLLRPTVEDRVALGRLVMILDEFRKVNPEMPLQQALTILTIAMEPGLTVSDVAKKAGLTLASVSRHLEALGPHNPSKGVGLGLVAYDYSPTDRRAKVVSLTAAGLRSVRSLIHLVSKS